MSDPQDDWQDLARQWRSNDRAVASEDIARQLRRERVQVLILMGAHWLGTLFGIATGAWLAMRTPFAVLGWGMVFFIVVSVVVAVRLREREVASGEQDVLTSIEAALSGDERLLTRLQTAHALGLAALLAVVMASTTQLRHLRVASTTALVLLLLGSLYVLATLIWSALLTRRARRRRNSMQALRERLRAESDSLSPLAASDQQAP